MIPPHHGSPRPFSMDPVARQVAQDLGTKAGSDAVAAIARAMSLIPDRRYRLFIATYAVLQVASLPLSIMMSRKDKTPEQVVEGLFEAMRPQLIDAVTGTRAEFANLVPETAPPPPVERGAPPVHPYNPRPDPARTPPAAPERKGDA